MKKSFYFILAALFCLPFFSFSQERYNLPLAQFNSLVLENDLEVFVLPGKECSVQVEASDDLRHDIRVNIDSKGVLHLVLGDKMKQAEKSKQLDKVRIFITAPEYKKFTLGKGAKVWVEGDIDAVDFEVVLKDNAEFNGKRINAKSAAIETKDYSRFTASIYAKSVSIEQKANSSVTIDNLVVSKDINCTLQENVKINITKALAEKLDIKIKGNSKATIHFEGKVLIAKGYDNGELILDGTANSGDFSAVGSSILNIRNLQAGNIKTVTEKGGVIQR